MSRLFALFIGTRRVINNIVNKNKLLYSEQLRAAEEHEDGERGVCPSLCAAPIVRPSAGNQWKSGV